MSEIETQRADRTAPEAPSGRTNAAPAFAPMDVSVRSAPAGPGVDASVSVGHSGPVDAQQLTRGGGIRKWDREPLPHDWRFYVGNLGKTLIAAGLLMFGFVGYQLYGTGIETAAAQSELEDQFEQQLSLVEPVSPEFAEGINSGVVVDAPQTGEPGDVAGPSDVAVVPGENGPATPTPDADSFTPSNEAVAPPAVPFEAQNLPDDLENGDALAKIEIPRIGVSDIVVAGVETGDLKRGPGHFPDTPLPGQLGNAAIAGHRTTYGQPFRNVDKLQVGDEIRMTTLSGVFVYKVTGQAIVEPSEYQVVATTNPNVANLTLTSCHPVFTAQQRIVIFSELDRTESAPVGEPVINYGRSAGVEAPAEIPGDLDVPTGDDDADIAAEPGAGVDPATPINDGDSTESLSNDAPVAADQLGSEAVNAGIADAFSEGWFSDPTANMQVGLWGVMLGAIAIAAYALSRRFRKDLLGLAVGLIPFTLALYFFFQNVNRLLPPNL
jgi:sortase A